MRKTIDTVNHEPTADRVPPEPGGPSATGSTPPPDGDDVLELVHAVMHAWRTRQYRALPDGLQGLTHMDAKVLGFFARHPGATQRELAENSGRDKAQLARLIKGLRERGLLDGEVDPADRRHVRLSPTPAGRRLQGTLQRHAQRLGEAALVELDEATRASLVRGLRRMRENLEG